MTKEEVYSLIAKVLDIDVGDVNEDLAIGDIPTWDSLNHLRLISAFESELGMEFDIEQTMSIEDVDDILELVLSIKAC